MSERDLQKEVQDWLAANAAEFVGDLVQLENGDWEISLRPVRNGVALVATDELPSGVYLTIHATKDTSFKVRPGLPDATRIELQAGQVDIQAQEGLGVDPPISDLRLVGHGKVHLQYVAFIRPVFDNQPENEHDTDGLRIGLQGTIVSGAVGDIGMLEVMSGQTIFEAEPSPGVSVHRLHGQVADVELEDISLFQLNTDHLGALQSYRRLRPWWPRTWYGVRRGNALRSARKMPMTATTEQSKRRQRAQFWSTVADRLREQHAGGEAETVARELALDARRRAAPTMSSPRWLLGAAAVFGYGTRFVKPIIVWITASLAFAVLLLLSIGTDLAWTRGTVDQIVSLWLDVFALPLAFVRSGLGRELSQLLETDGAGFQRLIVLGARAIGTASLVFAAVAAARLSRTRAM